MVAFPTAELRFDAAIGLTEILKLTDGPALREAYAHARSVADRDDDHPQRRFWDLDAGTPKSAVTSWSATEKQLNLNRMTDEALWCDVHGLRPQSLKYASGAMRDGGGYRST